jgi:hypothetical protein
VTSTQPSVKRQSKLPRDLGKIKLWRRRWRGSIRWRLNKARQQKLVHKCNWANVLPSDWLELLSVKDKYDRDGRIFLKILCDLSMNLTPGAGYSGSSMHALMTALRSIAL